MYNFKQSLFGAILFFSLGAQAQTPATELIRKDILELERGQSIDVYDQYTVVGSKFGKSGSNGAAMLFQNGNYIRSYRTSPINTHDGLGHPKTVAIGQHAIVLGAPTAMYSTGEIGKVGIVKKTWDGTHYQTNISQVVMDGNSASSSDNNTKFGTAVAISGSWIAVGAPQKGTEGGVKMFFRDHGTGQWVSKGYIALPNFENAPHRYPVFGGRKSTIASKAGFGSSVAIMNNNLIVGAPGIGSFYIYAFDGNQWKYKSEYKGTNYVGGMVSISDEYAVSSSGNIVEVYKKNGDNTWGAFQKITENAHVNDVATEGSRLALGKANGGVDSHGEVSYYELRSYQSGSSWVYNFKKIGKMYVKVNGSPNGMKNHKLLGYSVSMHGSIIVAGAPNAYYESVADGAGFRANFHNMTPVNRQGSFDENESDAVLQMFPNPATDFVKINSDNKILSANAINTMGLSAELPVINNNIDVSSLESGVYSISVITENDVFIEKITVR